MSISSVAVKHGRLSLRCSPRRRRGGWPRSIVNAPRLFTNADQRWGVILGSPAARLNVATSMRRANGQQPALSPVQECGNFPLAASHVRPQTPKGLRNIGCIDTIDQNSSLCSFNRCCYLGSRTVANLAPHLPSNGPDRMNSPQHAQEPIEMKFTLSRFPHTNDALKPQISPATPELHQGKHRTGYLERIRSAGGPLAK